MSIKVILKLAYDGTEFHGWQVQKNTRTVQGVLAQAWQKLTGELQYPEGSGRTDAGVHAHGQMASFRLGSHSIPPERCSFALNNFLPRDVRILKSCAMDESFDVRRCAISRTYHYYLMPAAQAAPQDLRYTLLLRRSSLQLCRLNALAALFVGRHDFRAFCSSDDQSPHKVRHVFKSAFSADMNGKICYHIQANGFLMNMVRAILGSILFFHDKEYGEQEILFALQSGEKTALGPVIAPVGLSLMHVEYPDFSI